MFDTRRIAEDSDDAKQLAQAIAARGDSRQVEAIVAAWKPELKAAPADMHCAFVKESGVHRQLCLHVQFATREDMARALSAVECLVPCCVGATSLWGIPPCSQLRHAVMERVDIECTFDKDVPDIKDDAKRRAAVDTLLEKLT